MYKLRDHYFNALRVTSLAKLQGGGETASTPPALMLRPWS